MLGAVAGRATCVGVVAAVLSSMSGAALAQGGVAPSPFDGIWATAVPVPAPDPKGPSPELTALYRQILATPTDTALNLRYAALAEQLGFRRKALTAYERILTYDPDNKEAQAGIDRIRRRLQPNETQFTFEFGGAFESNPAYSPTLRNGEA